MDIDEHAKNYSEISKYLIHPHSEAISDVKQLHSFPVVMNLFRKFNVILPSEADIERLFSFAGRLMLLSLYGFPNFLYRNDKNMYIFRHDNEAPSPTYGFRHI